MFFQIQSMKNLIDKNKYLYFRRLDLIFLDITKKVLRKLGKEKIPPTLLPSVYPGKINLETLF